MDYLDYFKWKPIVFNVVKDLEKSIPDIFTDYMVCERVMGVLFTNSDDISMIRYPSFRHDNYKLKQKIKKTFGNSLKSN